MTSVLHLKKQIPNNKIQSIRIPQMRHHRHNYVNHGKYTLIESIIRKVVGFVMFFFRSTLKTHSKE